jgi:hypothetical protein
MVALMLLGRDLAVRFLLMLLPLAALGLAGGWSRRWPTPRGAFALLLAWVALAGSWLPPYYRDYMRGDYASALRVVEAGERPGDVVVFNGPWQTLLFEHYYRGSLPSRVLTGAVPLVEGQVATALADVAQQYRGLWLLETDMGHADPTGFVPRWLGRYAYRADVHEYRQVRVAHYLLGEAPVAATAVEHAYPGVHLVEVRVGGDGILPGQLARLELAWRVEEDYEPGYKVSVRLRDRDGVIRWWVDPWVGEAWIADRPPDAGDLLYTRLAAGLPPESPPGPYALELVLYRSTERAESGEGWIAWSAPPLRLSLDAVGRPSPPLVALP